MLYCTHCDYVVDTTVTDAKVLKDIREWIAMMLRLKGTKPGSSDIFNAEHVPCPKCRKTNGWAERNG